MPELAPSDIVASIGNNKSLVIIGPNGVGKTQLGVAIARTNNSERVAALRNVEISGIPMQTLQQASQEVRSALQQALDAHWRQSFELQTLLAEILAEDREQAVAYRKLDMENPATSKDPSLTNTRLLRIISIWNRHFPGREIDINYSPEVVRQMPNGSVSKYSIAQMSEGERTALYLISRVISCTQKILLVDEPETFFHPVLARNLWDDLEREAPDIKFIYITHDISFALSRHNARIAIARPENKAELLPENFSLPDDVISEVLGAASFSISASRLIFCEGKMGSLDLSILRAWHNCPNTAVIPVGSCNSVRECVSVFRAGHVTSGITAMGYVDRDGWPDSYLTSDPNVKPLFVNEIEGLFCVEDVFIALAKYNRITNPEDCYSKFIAEAKSQFSNAILNKEILQRAKLRIELDQRNLFNSVNTHDDLNELKKKFISVAPSGGWEQHLQKAISAEEIRLSGSLAASPSDFLRDFPAKSYYKIAAKHLGLIPEKMVELVCSALEFPVAESSSEKSLAELRNAIVRTLEPHFWPRTFH